MRHTRWLLPTLVLAVVCAGRLGAHQDLAQRTWGDHNDYSLGVTAEFSGGDQQAVSDGLSKDFNGFHTDCIFPDNAVIGATDTHTLTWVLPE
jgi:hypothetical protein